MNSDNHERDALAKAMCAIEARSKASSLEEVQAGIQRWMRHRYEAERLIEELADYGFNLRRTVQGEPDLEYAQAFWHGDGPSDFTIKKMRAYEDEQLDEGYFWVRREVRPWQVIEGEDT